MQPGQLVRLIGSPGEIGTLTDQRRERNGRVYVTVGFPGGKRILPMDQLELLKAGETPSDQLRNVQFSRAIDLRRAITHRRLTGRLADVIYSMEATNTDFYPYQFKPVLKLLASATNGLLIADEVGLGKTIEAGLIWTELRARFDMRRLLVVCPVALREKWRFELTSKLGVDAELTNAQGLYDRLASPEAAQRGFALIASLQGLRPPKHRPGDREAVGTRAKLAELLDQSQEKDDLVDLMILDEAHHIRNAETANSRLAELLREVSTYRVFLTATPVHNSNSDLFTLLKLLDPDTFRHTGDLDRILSANEPLVRAREMILRGDAPTGPLLDLLDHAGGHPLLARNRQIASIRSALTEHEGPTLTDPEVRSRLAYRIDSVNLLSNTLTRTRKRDVHEMRVVRDPTPEFIEMHPVEAEFYAAASDVIRDYAALRDASEGFLLAMPQRQLSSCMAAALRTWTGRRVALDRLDLDDDDTEQDDVETTDGAAVAPASGPLVEELRKNAPDLGSVAELARHDSKYGRLVERLRHALADDPRAKIVVFSGFRGTLRYLEERLFRDGISSVVLMGSGRTKHERIDKSEVIEVFRADGGPSVLLTSEVGGEGIDLQFSRFLVNYDLPWNPMRIEQRIGRLDRLGQKAEKIVIWNLLHQGTIDERIYVRLYEKLDLCRRSLGDFEEVVGTEIRILTNELLSGRLTTEQQERRIDQTAQALENVRREQEDLEQKAHHLSVYGDYVLHRVREAHQLRRWVSSEDVRSYVIDCLRHRFSGCEFRADESNPLLYDISLSDAAKVALEEFLRAKRLPRTRLQDNRPEPIRCRFDHRVGREAGSSVEVISQFHPVVRFVSHMLRDGQEELRPAVAVRLPAGRLEVPAGVYVVAASYWTLTGLRTTEKLEFAGVCLASPGRTGPVDVLDEVAERLLYTAVECGEDWPGVSADASFASAFEAAENCFGRLSDRFEAYRRETEAENADRADIQERSLRQHRAEQRMRLEGTLADQVRAGMSIQRATQGRIEALDRRLTQDLLKIEQRRRIEAKDEEVLVAIIHVGNSHA
jgi:superfamily II DNA or RNA helicase